MKKQNQGITLISLVITIIILLILAGISISALTGSGLFEKAKIARNRTQEEQELENQMLLEYENQVNQLGGTSSAGGGEEVKFTNINLADTNPAGAMPNGAKTIETDGSKGIVIKDSKDNEWTWIEVPKTEVFKTAKASDEHEAIKTDLINYLTSPKNYRSDGFDDLYYEWCGVTAKDGKTAQQVYEEMYQKMLSSVYTHGGFWVSSYELGIKGSNTDVTLGRTTHTDITESSPEAVSQVDHIPYNYITCSEAQILASTMTTDFSKTSSLLFGIQWDLICKHLLTKAGWKEPLPFAEEDNVSWGNYKNSELKITSNNAKRFETDTNIWSEIKGTKPKGEEILLTTGASNETNKMNIFDISGNVDEYTLESNKDWYNSVIFRGAAYKSNYPGSTMSGRAGNTFNTSYNLRGARASLY